MNETFYYLPSTTLIMQSIMFISIKYIEVCCCNVTGLHMLCCFLHRTYYDAERSFAPLEGQPVAVCPMSHPQSFGPCLPVGTCVLKKWQYTMSILGPNTCSDSNPGQLHISIYKFSPSVPLATRGSSLICLFSLCHSAALSAIKHRGISINQGSSLC